MKIAVFNLREDGTGNIEIYEVPASRAFNAKVAYEAPQEDWTAIKEWLKEKGKLVQTITPDFSFKVDL